jgi:TPR repeat protein
MKGDNLVKRAKKIEDNLYRNAYKLNKNQLNSLYQTYLKLIRRAAYMGNADGQLNLAMHYDNVGFWGSDNPFQNTKKCFFWYKKSCDNNNSDACLALSRFYNIGIFVGKDIYTANKLLKKSFMLGCELAALNLAINYKKKCNYKRALYWLKEYVKLVPDDGDGLFELAMFYLEGKGLEKSHKVAYELLIKASKLQNISQHSKNEIYFEIGKMFYYGLYVKKSLAKAKYLFELANINNDHEEISDFLKKNNPILIKVKKEKVVL